MAVRRFDGSRISNLRRTPTGGVVVACAATRTGIFEYTDNTGKVIREYRSPEEVFKAVSLASLKGAAVTEKHPPEMVNPGNWSLYNRGNVVEDSVKRDADHVVLDLAVNDARTIKGIDSGELCEASCGYDCELDNTPGVTPEGEPYDRAQRNIVYNHVALGPKDWARGGNTVCLRLDSRGNQCLTVPTAVKALARKPRTMIRLPKIERLKGHVLRIDGVDYRLKTAEGRKQAEAAIKSVNERLKAEGRADSVERKDDGGSEVFDKIIQGLMDLQVMVHQAAAQAGAQAEAIEAPAEGADVASVDADGATQEAPPEAVKKDEGTDEEKAAKMDQAVAKRTETIVKARAFIPDLKTVRADGKIKPDAEIMREVLTVAKFDHKGLSDGEVRGAFAVVKPHATHPSLATMGGATGASTRADGGEAKPKSSAVYKERLAGAWRTGNKG